MTEHVQLTEQTRKRWKAIQAGGVIVLILGIFVLFFGGDLENPSEEVRPVPTAMIFGGFLAYAYGRFAGWWYHG